MRLACVLLVVLSCCFLPGGSASAQEPDTTIAPPPPLQPLPMRAEVRAPLTPGGAFLRSFLVPGWSQHVLGRPRAGAFFVATEFVSAVMMVDARQRLQTARRWGRDSMVVGWELPAAPGEPPRPIVAPGPLAGRIPPRRQQVEDWTAVLLFNHLLSGADAFVAAHLWELPVQLEFSHDGVDAIIGVRIPWQP
jgi:hypothetical protein